MCHFELLRSARFSGSVLPAPERSKDRDANVAGHRARIEALLRDVTSLDDDRILRRFLNLIGGHLLSVVSLRAEEGLIREIYIVLNPDMRVAV